MENHVCSGRLAVKPVLSVLRWSWSTGDVVEAEVAGRIGRDAAGESADDVAALLGNLVRVGDMELAEMRQLRRAQRHLPGADQRAIDGDGEVHVRFAEVGVVEEVVHAVLDGVHVEKPAFVWNLDAELVLFVALGGDGREGVFARRAGCSRSSAPSWRR